jgi:hypothetical protein
MKEGLQGACLVIFSPGENSSVPFGSGEMRMGVSGASLLDTFDDESEAIDVACAEIGLPKNTLYKISMMLSQNTLNKWM